MHRLIGTTALIALSLCGCTEQSDGTTTPSVMAGAPAAGGHGGAVAGTSAGGQPNPAGGSSQGGAEQGGAAHAGAEQGGAGQGGAGQGGAGQGGAGQGGAGQGGAGQGGAAQGGTAQSGLPPVEGQVVSPPPSPVPVADGSVQVCETGDTWVTLLSKNNVGCAKACQSQGMNCRRSYHDVAGACEPQPYELGCGHLAEQGTDFCACSSETFFQGKLYTESPKTRVAPPIETCQAGDGWATLVFHDRSGCNAACALAGLQCYASYEDLELECGPQADPAFKLDCNNSLAHVSDFCVCTVDGSAAGLPPSVVTPWRPF
jgi:hypothetical protein